MQPVKIKSILKKTLKSHNLFDIYRHQRALILWERICGKEVAAVTRPEKLRGRTLFISTRDHIWAQEISGFTQIYLEKYKKMLGEGVVREIRFNAKPDAFHKKQKRDSSRYEPQNVELSGRDDKKIEQMLEEVTDEKSRELLKKFLQEKTRYEKWLKKRGGNTCPDCGAVIEKELTYCPPCMHGKEKENTGEIFKMLDKTPWMTYREASSQIKSITRSWFENVKTTLADSVHAEIMQLINSGKDIPDGEIKSLIITYAMLISSRKPSEMKDDILSGLLPGELFKIYKS